jgi:lipoprotein NlpD
MSCITSFLLRQWIRPFAGLYILLCCTACGTANWQAPLETRTSRDTPSSEAATYQVQSGDTLFSIAWRHQLDYQHLAQLNGIVSPYLIRPGQTLSLQRAIADGAVPAPRLVAPPSGVTTRPATQPIRTAIRWAWPVQGKLASSFKAGSSLRKGIKLAVPAGTPVRASAAGRVVYSGNGLIGYGQLVIIKHDADYLSAYGHNRKLTVKTGQRVSQGALIAESGRMQAGQSRLHFEIRRRGKPIDPLRVLPSR